MGTAWALGGYWMGIGWALDGHFAGVWSGGQWVERVGIGCVLEARSARAGRTLRGCWVIGWAGRVCWGLGVGWVLCFVRVGVG